MSHLTQPLCAFNSGGMAPQVSGSSSSLSLIRCNGLIQAAGPAPSSPPPQQVTEGRESGREWRGSGGPIIQIPHMFPPQYSRVFEIAGMPADWARDAARLRGERRQSGREGRMRFLAQRCGGVWGVGGGVPKSFTYSTELFYIFVQQRGHRKHLEKGDTSQKASVCHIHSRPVRFDTASLAT